jgi:tetraacyldisaccharide 4'-kinase
VVREIGIELLLCVLGRFLRAGPRRLVNAESVQAEAEPGDSDRGSVEHGHEALELASFWRDAPLALGWVFDRAIAEGARREQQAPDAEQRSSDDHHRLAGVADLLDRVIRDHVGSRVVLGHDLVVVPVDDAPVDRGSVVQLDRRARAAARVQHRQRRDQGDDSCGPRVTSSGPGFHRWYSVSGEFAKPRIHGHGESKLRSRLEGGYLPGVFGVDRGVLLGFTGARAFAGHLERGSLGRRSLARVLSAVWARAADPVRPLELPEAARVIGIGGATLGGAGKSVVALELARALAASGERAAVVAPAYPARDRTPRRVNVDDAVAAPGDEALWLARALHDDGVPVFVGAPRSEAVALAAAAAPIVIVDGLLQARPRRLAWSVLALDGAAPWGASRCPPAGDLRARKERLLEACDAVLLGFDAVLPAPDPCVQFHGKTTFSWSSELSGAWTPEGRFVALDELRGLRLGLLLAIARPERVAAALEARGVAVACKSLHADHAVPTPRPNRGLDAWLTTAKCATKVRQTPGSTPVWTLEHRAQLPADFVERAARFARG